MEAPNSIVLFIAVTAFILTYLFRPRHKTPELPYPPGPTPDSMPTHDAWVQYCDWGKEYGQVLYIRNRNILIINDLEVANDLLEKRARTYSDRETTLVMELVTTTQRYSNKWRKSRKIFQQNFRQAASDSFYPAQYKEVQTLLRGMVTAPEQFMHHTMAYVMFLPGLIYSTVYGLDIGPDHYIARTTAEIVHELFDIILLHGSFPTLERFPWLRYMPSWFPGCRFKRIAKQTLRSMQEMYTTPFDIAVNNLKSGTGTSLIAELAVKNEGNPEEIESLKAMGFVCSLGKIVITGSSISSFLLAMVMHPDVQVRGQEEIDSVIGGDRLPTFEDRQSLPYVESIYREVMRLYPPLPLGVSHATTEDDVYRGYHIPQGCIVISNIWAMNRDPEIYPEPDKFSPERYFDSPDGPFRNISDISAFGFGRRRVCPGRYMADNTVWLTIASVLATLTISKAKDEKGSSIEIPGEFTNGFFCHPKPYQCSISPRSQDAKELILAVQ
ncbi:hypothetical protein GYMLUDRAFT_158739 [Collybiopsis luxurians FD-317 M1]|nr:hypothetical protein GYMLUDRAFT_158739 [Collybiopsis luxurians FD-317 M1]